MKNRKIIAVIIIIVLLVVSAFAYQYVEKASTKIFPLAAEEMDTITGMYIGHDDKVYTFRYEELGDVSAFVNALNNLSLKRAYRVSYTPPENSEIVFYIHWTNGTRQKSKLGSCDIILLNRDTVVVKARNLKTNQEEWTYYNVDYSGVLNVLNEKRMKHYKVELESGETPADAVAKFAYEVYAKYLQYSPKQTEITEYDVVWWNVYDVNEAQDAVVGLLEYAFIPVVWDSPDIWAGNTAEGTGKYKGMLTRTCQFLLERQKDGTWICTEIGTGGVQLPEK